MSALQVLNYNQSDVRMVMQDDGPWWVLADVCRVLELKQPHRVATRLDDDERTFLTVVDSAGKHQEMIAVNEPGLYSVILRSSKPEAKAFKRWITHDVLPTIRRTGSYGQSIPSDVLNQLLASTQILTQSVQILAQEVASIKVGQRGNQTNWPALEGAPEDVDGFMNSMEVARILGRPHNNVLKGIRATVERARLEGVQVDKHFIICYRTHWNNMHCPYYRMDETAISMFSRAMKNLTLAEKLRSAFKEKERHI